MPPSLLFHRRNSTFTTLQRSWRNFYNHSKLLYFLKYSCILFHYVKCHNLCNQFPIDGQVGCLQCFPAVTKHSATNSFVCMSFCIPVHKYYRINFQQQNCWSKGISICNFDKCCQITFHGGCNNLHHHQQCIRVPADL